MTSTKRVIIIAVLAIALGVVWFELYSLFCESRLLSSQKSDLEKQIDAVSNDTRQTQDDLTYYSIPENLQRVVKEKLNYKEVGEKLIIVIPHQ